jgi:hypothetical protein
MRPLDSSAARPTGGVYHPAEYQLARNLGGSVGLVAATALGAPEAGTFDATAAAVDIAHEFGPFGRLLTTSLINKNPYLRFGYSTTVPGYAGQRILRISIEIGRLRFHYP